MVIDVIELPELDLDELSVTSMRDAVARPETATVVQPASCCLSQGCCCSCYIPNDPI